MTAADVVLRATEGDVLLDGADRWHAPASDAERALLRRLPAPVLDLGCGPGRLVVALMEDGTPALGVDLAAGAVALAAAQGAAVLRRSVFARVPGEGRWGSAVLLDGNVGIGGDPIALLVRAGHLVRPGGLVAVELTPGRGRIRTTSARVERDGAAGPWFPWSLVGLAALPDLAGAAGLSVDEVLHLGTRPVALLRRPA